ncbi:Na+/H+ antiporter subunit G [Pokkaliibacter sp. CJK22405]|uniref:Na+/H+ antiporter subunit G n=1 Tax=Pokkaliibacter sp. CJK22405 TaxID=3384615 RepID=UPI00398531AF
MSLWIEILIAALLLIGGVFTLIGAYGLVRLPDFYTRLHAPTKATTLGLGAILIASMIGVSVEHGGISVHEVLITLFLFITAPVSAHMLARTGIHMGTEPVEKTRHADDRFIAAGLQHRGNPSVLPNDPPESAPKE